MSLWGPGPGYRDDVIAESLAHELAMEATAGQTGQKDPAGERAEGLTNALQSVVALAILVAAIVGGAWLFSGTTAALMAAGVAGLAALVFLVLRRSKKAEVNRARD